MSRIIDLGKAHGPIPVDVAGVGSSTTLYYGHASSGAPTYTINGGQATGSLTLDVADIGGSLAHFSPYADALGNTGTAILIPATGTYRIQATLPCVTSTASTGPGNIQLAVFVNGALRNVLAAGYVSSTGAALYLNGSALLSLNGGQYVEVGVVNGSPAPLVYNVNSHVLYQIANLTVSKVGS